jgi:hypothetical protein
MRLINMGLPEFNSPNMAETISSVADEINEWLKENPAIENEDAARQAKLFIDRGMLGIEDMEDERRSRTDPLRLQVEAINSEYKPSRKLIDDILAELQCRLAAFLQAEEARREALLAEAQAAAEEAERIARAAEDAEKEAFGLASEGELGVDIKAATVAADDAFTNFKQAIHRAKIAEKEAKVKIGGGFRRSISLRNQVTLTVTDAIAAVRTLGPSTPIVEAIIKSAKAYEREVGEYPPGVSVAIDRKL